MAAWRTGPGTGPVTRWRILRAIDRFHEETGEWPSPAQVTARLGLPAKTLQYHTRILEKETALRRAYNGRALILLRPVPEPPPGVSEDA